MSSKNCKGSVESSDVYGGQEWDGVGNKVKMGNNGK